MRGYAAGAVVALVIVGVVLFTATMGALGVAAIGWLLHMWFDLSQWQGTLIALGVATGLGFVIQKVATQPAVALEEDTGAPCADEDQSRIVPWRRSRQSADELSGRKARSDVKRPK